MLLKVVTVAGAALCLALPAVAQPAATDAQPTMGQPVQGMNSSSIRQHITADLKKAGYADVKIMPASFVATAKNKQGDEVTMLITPDSVTTITDVPAAQSASTGKTATASNSK